MESNEEANIADTEPAVILSICYSGGFLGAAVYNQEKTTIKVVRDVGEDLDFQMVKSLIYQVQPSTVLLNKGQDLHFMRYVSDLCGLSNLPEEKSESIPGSENNANDGDDESSFDVINNCIAKIAKSDSSKLVQDDDDEEELEEISVHLLPNAAFNFNQATKRITQLFASECFSDSESALVLNFRVDTTSTNMIRSLGALLKYMDAVRIGVEYEALNVCTPVTAMKNLMIDQMVEIDNTTYRALEIFSENRKKEISWKKTVSSDGRKASLFSLCNRSRSTPGRNLLRKWFEHPTLDRETLLCRQAAISFFMKECNVEFALGLQQSLGQIRSLRLILRRMRASTCSVLHWENLFKTLMALVDIGRCLKENNINLKIMKDSMHYFGDQLSEITTVVATLCDFEESRLENRLVVKRGVDPQLDEVKHIYRQLPFILTRVAKEEADRLKADRCSVGYIPMVGYILQLSRYFPVDNYPDLHVMFSNNDGLNVKSNKMEQLDQELGDLKMQIIDKETTVMLRLQKLIMQSSNLILHACNGAAILDAIISLSLTARHYGWTCPNLVDQSIIDAVEVVHPLSQLVSKDSKFVANPVKSGEQYSTVKIFTGPNACGKSVYLKQVGVLAFLAHIGSFVPAQRAKIGPINRIMTRMYTVDGVLDGMSTFAKDIAQVALALRRGNRDSLVIIDEFGKGTMTEVGLSLLTASLNFWISKGNEGCPHLFVASHFHALPQLINLSEDLISFNTLEVVKRGAQLEFKFRLVEGIVSKSFAAYTASKMGIPADVVDRANEVYDFLRSGIALSEVKACEDEESKCDWLAQRMDNFMYELETWNIDQDFHELLNRIEEVLLEEDETVTSVCYNALKCEENNEEGAQSCSNEDKDNDSSSSQNNKSNLSQQPENNDESLLNCSKNASKSISNVSNEYEETVATSRLQVPSSASTSPVLSKHSENTVRSHTTSPNCFVLKNSLSIPLTQTPRVNPDMNISRSTVFSFDSPCLPMESLLETPDITLVSPSIENDFNLSIKSTLGTPSPTERSILKTPGSKGRGNLSVSFMLENDEIAFNKSSCRDFSVCQNLFTTVSEEKKISIVSPINSSMFDGFQEDTITLDDEGGNAEREPRVSPNVLHKQQAETPVPLKRALDFSLFSVLSDEKVIPLKRLRSC